MNMQIIKNLKNFNPIFLSNNKNGFKINKTNHMLRKGSIPVLISAPHAVRQYRCDSTKASDYLTGALALSLAEQLDCFAFVRNCNNQDDPNFPIGKTLPEANTMYLQYLLNMIELYDIQLVIDLHGCSDQRNFDCSIWSDNFKTCDSNIISIFKEKFNEYNISCDENGTEYLGGQVTRQVSRLTNVFQLEVKRSFRSLDVADRDNLSSFIEAMENSIHKVYKYNIK